MAAGACAGVQLAAHMHTVCIMAFKASCLLWYCRAFFWTFAKCKMLLFIVQEKEIKLASFPGTDLSPPPPPHLGTRLQCALSVGNSSFFYFPVFDACSMQQWRGDGLRAFITWVTSMSSYVHRVGKDWKSILYAHVLCFERWAATFALCKCSELQFMDWCCKKRL